jgi:hypothetical protein
VVDVGHQDFANLVNKTDTLAFSNALRTATLNLSHSVVQCYSKGGRTVAVMNCMDPNRIPRLARLTSNPTLARERAQEINVALNRVMAQLAATYPDIAVFGFLDDSSDPLVAETGRAIALGDV